HEPSRAVANAGYVANLAAAPRLARGDGAVAYLAIEPPDAPWPPLKAGESATAGPFYLVWVRPELGRIQSGQWPYQIARIESVAPIVKRYPVRATAPGMSAQAPL